MRLLNALAPSGAGRGALRREAIVRIGDLGEHTVGDRAAAVAVGSVTVLVVGETMTLSNIATMGLSRSVKRAAVSKIGADA